MSQNQGEEKKVSLVTGPDFIPMTRELVRLTNEFSKTWKPELLSKIIEQSVNLLERGWEERND